MKALIVYESMWGNTQKVAEAIAAGLRETVDVEVMEVGHAPEEPGSEVALVVAGGPTHAFSMTRPSTRADAVTKGAPQGSSSTGLREWLDGLPSGHHPQGIATFDTRVRTVRHLPGSAAKSAAKTARRHGYERAAVPQSFYVDDVAGPLLEGELDRATAWGRDLAAALAQTSS
jgi:Flavodoxin domain